MSILTFVAFHPSAGPITEVWDDAWDVVNSWADRREFLLKGGIGNEVTLVELIADKILQERYPGCEDLIDCIRDDCPPDGWSWGDVYAELKNRRAKPTEDSPKLKEAMYG